jgi:high-affinity iron transporter
VRINLSKFFRYTGIALVVVAAGILSYGIHDLQEAALLPGLSSLAFDVSGAVPPDSWYGTLLKGTVNFTPDTTWLQAIAWTVYLVVVMTFFLRPTRTAPAPAGAPAPAS